jgi:hypothetical protein
MGCFSSKPAGVRVPPAIATPRRARAAAPSPFPTRDFGLYLRPNVRFRCAPD